MEITLKTSRLMSILRCFLLILLTMLSSHKALSASKTPIRVAVAANFAPILEQILPQFTQKHDIAVQIISGSTGTLFLQIKHGARVIKNAS